MIDNINGNWLVIIIPILVFGATLIVLLWLRTRTFTSLERLIAKSRWKGSNILVQSIKRPLICWSLIISALLALAVTDITLYWKTIIGKSLWSLFVITCAFTLITIVNGFSSFLTMRSKQHKQIIRVARHISIAIIAIIAILTLLDTWGIPTTHLLLSILIILVVLTLIFRGLIPNIIASFQINTAGQLKVGDYIRLEEGEEGYITEINWKNTRLSTLEESTVIIPNNRLTRSTIVNYGHLLKKAKEPFRFNSRTHLTQLTGLKAKNLQELADILKNAPDATVYYHTHHFLEEQYYSVPQLSNDFAVWVDNTLGNDILSEKLASIDPFGFSSLSALRERLVSVMMEYLATTPASREAAEGREFHFMKAVSVIFPIAYVAHDLRELTEALRKISLGSLYYHIFESKMRLGKGLNDFTVWIRDNLDEPGLAEEIARINPYTYTLEGLRSSLIQRIERHIK